MKKYQKFKAMFVLIFLAFSCTEKDDQDPNEIQSQATLNAAVAEGSSASSSINGKIIIGGFAANEFRVGIKDVIMNYAAKAEILAGIGIGNINLKSNVNTSLQTSAAKNKTLVLVSEGDSQIEVVGDGNTPEGNYTEVEFKLYRNKQVNKNELYFDKSLFIEGELQGSPSIIWMNAEKTLIASAESAEGVEVVGQTKMIMVFELTRLFEDVDFSSAVDGNGNGRIEIGPNNEDGNASLYSKIESNLESSVILKKQ